MSLSTHPNANDAFDCVDIAKFGRKYSAFRTYLTTAVTQSN